jgi:hypothetical protein
MRIDSQFASVISYSFFFGVGCLRGFTNSIVAAAFFTTTTGFINFGGMLSRYEACDTRRWVLGWKVKRPIGINAGRGRLAKGRRKAKVKKNPNYANKRGGPPFVAHLLLVSGVPAITLVKRR